MTTMVAPPRMTPARWVMLLSMGALVVAAAWLGWLALLGALVVCAVVGGVLRYRATRMVMARTSAQRVEEVEAAAAHGAPLVEPMQLCESCGVFGAPRMELTADGRHWQLECMECGFRWFDPPTFTRGVVVNPGDD